MAKKEAVVHKEPTALVEFPIAEPEAGTYIASWQGHLNIALYGVERETFKKVLSGLRAKNALLADGRPVSGYADVVKWAVAQIALQIQD